MQQYHSHHPDPDGEYWTIRVNTDLDQHINKIKEITTSAALGVRRKGYILFNSAGDIIGMQFYQEPKIETPKNARAESPSEEESFQGFDLSFKMPEAMGLFPPYEVLVKIMKKG